MPRPVLTRAASGGTKTHPAGGFVCRITGVKFKNDYEYAEVRYEIAEGDHAGLYEYSCDFRRYIESRFEGATQFEKFMTALEECNPGFDMDAWQTTWAEGALVGKLFGAVFRERIYESPTTGERRTKPDFVYACSLDSIRSGRFNVPDPKDTTARAQASAPTAAAPAPAPVTGGNLYAEDIPF